jgi:phosphoserine aminotransferase
MRGASDTDQSDLPVIPGELLPKDGRFGSGPTKVRPEAVRALGEWGTELLGTSHRQAPVRGLVARLQNGLAQLFDLPEDHEVVLGVGGATAFWESAAFCLVEDSCLHYVFGEFSTKFAAAVRAAPWLSEPVVLEAPPGERPDTMGDELVDTQALTHNETSTGVMMDVVRPAGDALVVVDATSGAGGLPVDLSQADAYYFSLQKGFGADGGLWVAFFSPAAVERAQRLGDGRYAPAFLDLAVAIENSRKSQTYNTPAISTLVLAVAHTEWMIDRGGLAWSVDDCAKKAAHVYGWAEEREWAAPFVTDSAARSNVVATIDLDDDLSADEVNRILRANGIVDTDGYRKLGRNQLRIGLFPAVDHNDVAAYTACVDWIAEHLL